MRFLRASNGELITFASTSLVGSGGEARVYAVQQDPALVAKIYHAPSAARGRKLAAMLANPPEDPMRAHGHASIAWPVDLLHSESSRSLTAGFLMPRVTGVRPIIDFYNPKTRREHSPLFNYLYLHRTAHNLAAALRALHECGYVIGDVREANILVNEHTLVTLVDTDSFQVRDPGAGVVYRCPVGTAEFTPRELHGKDFASTDRAPEHDLFGLAVLLFQLLMEGIHPFAGIYTGSGDPPPYEARIAEGHFPHGSRRCPYRPIATAVPFTVLDPGLRRLFLLCFDQGHADPKARPDADTWLTALEEAEHHLVACSANDQHRYGRHLKSCPWCERAARLGGRDPFPSRQAVQRGQVLPQLVPRPRPRPGRVLPVLPGVGVPGPTRRNPAGWLGIWLALIGLALIGLALIEIVTLVVSLRHSAVLFGGVVCGSAAAVCGVAGLLRARRIGGKGRLAAGWALGLGAGVTLFAALLAGFWEEEGDPTGSSAGKARGPAEQRTGPPSPWAFDAKEAKRRQNEAASFLGVAPEQDVDLGGGARMTFVLIPSGQFDMGSPGDEEGRFANERLQRVRILEPFWIGKYEVTQEQWRAVMGDNPSRFRGDRNPVENVSWTMCQDFLSRLTAWGGKGAFALPTQAEWEWACRAGSSARFSFGDRDADLHKYAWYSANSHPNPQQVGLKEPNAWGLYDMHGNVQEWTVSTQASYSGADARGTDGQGEERVIRGGSCVRGPRVLRSAYSTSQFSTTRDETTGFRVVWHAGTGRTGEAATPPTAIERPKPKAEAPPPVEEPKGARVVLPPVEWPKEATGFPKIADLPKEATEFPGIVQLPTVEWPKGGTGFPRIVELPKVTARGWPFDAQEAKRRQDQAARSLGVKPREDVDIGNGVKLSLVLIPAGEFVIGSPKGEGGQPDFGGDQKRVSIEKPFWIGQYEVTQQQWQAIMESIPSEFRGANHPVDMVSWDDAQKFVSKLSARVPGRAFALPTEAQWEYACRAGEATRFSLGAREENPDEFAWHSGNSGGTSHAVGLKKPNAWGLYDMYGNVWEWCSSPYWVKHDSSELAGADVPGGTRVLRGGCYDSSPWLWRFPYRPLFLPAGWDRDIRYGRIGFRVSSALATVVPKASGKVEQPKAAEGRQPPAEPPKKGIEAPQPAVEPKGTKATLLPAEPPKKGIEAPQLAVEPKGTKATLPPVEPPKKAKETPTPVAQPKVVTRGWPFNANEAKEKQEKAARSLGVKPRVDVDIGKDVKLSLVLIPAGEFVIGSPKDEEGRSDRAEDQKPIRIEEPFWMGKYEVTQEQWEAVMGYNPSAFGGPKNPVENVSWNDAQEFVKKLNARVEGGRFALPTEAQWEYACRAGAATRFSLGDSEAALDECAWRWPSSGGATHPVGAKKPNAWGLCDMLGNVWEWCASPYFTGSEGEESAGADAQGQRFLRGGSWRSDPSHCRSACRSGTVPSRTTDGDGFRVSRTLK